MGRVGTPSPESVIEVSTQDVEEKKELSQSNIDIVVPKGAPAECFGQKSKEIREDNPVCGFCSFESQCGKEYEKVGVS